MDEYSDKIQTQLVAKIGQREARQRAQQEIQGDIDFIGDAEDTLPPDLEELNLFGVPLNELDGREGGDEESLKDRNLKREFVKELLEVLETLDAQKDADGIGLA